MEKLETKFKLQEFVFYKTGSTKKGPYKLDMIISIYCVPGYDSISYGLSGHPCERHWQKDLSGIDEIYNTLCAEYKESKNSINKEYLSQRKLIHLQLAAASLEAERIN